VISRLLDIVQPSVGEPSRGGCNVPEYGLIIGLSVMAIAVAAVAMISLTTAQPTHADSDFKSDWAVEGGFDIISDADVFRFPTAIAFIPNPGIGPNTHHFLPMRYGVSMLQVVRVHPEPVGPLAGSSHLRHRILQQAQGNGCANYPGQVGSPCLYGLPHFPR
jgi:hypothetical protein